MDFAVVLPAIFLGLVASAIIVLFLGVVFRASFGNTRGWADKLRLKRKKKLLALADSLMQSGPAERVQSLLRQSFYLEHIRSSPDVIDQVVNHHLALLARFVAISEQYSSHLKNLAVVEELLISRAELMKAYIEVVTSQSNLSERRRDQGRALPNWAKDDFHRRLDEINSRLSTNRQTLEAQLDSLFASLKAMPTSSEVTYH